MSDFDTDNYGSTESFCGYIGSRSKAFKRGDIIDVSDHADVIGFKWPVAVTRSVWERCIQWADERNLVANDVYYQTESMRTTTLIFFVARFIRDYKERCRQLVMNFECFPGDQEDYEEELEVPLIVSAHRGDEKEPVITIHINRDDHIN